VAETEIHNIVLQKGADFEAVIEFWDDDGNIDISGESFEGSGKEDINDPDPAVFEFVFDTFQDSEDGNKWKLSMTLPDTTIDALDIKSGAWDLFRIFSDGIRSKPLKGGFTVEKKV